MTTRTIQRYHSLLLLLIGGLITLIGNRFYEQYQSRQAATKILSTCGLPTLPEGFQVRDHHWQESSTEGHVHVTLWLEAEQHSLDRWLNTVDEWQKRPPNQIVQFSLRESEVAPAVFFNADLELAATSTPRASEEAPLLRK